jgi:hypothetical protein
MKITTCNFHVFVVIYNKLQQAPLKIKKKGGICMKILLVPGGDLQL